MIHPTVSSEQKTPYPAAYVAYLAHFHGDRDYFECHEVLEAYWQLDRQSDLAPLWVGLIQLAVSLYHERRGNLAGAVKMLGSAIRLLSDYRLFTLGLDASRLMPELRARLKRLQAQVNTNEPPGAGEEGAGNPLPFADINLPLTDAALLQAAQELALSQGFVWGAPSDFTQEALLHRHTRRDRSEVIAARRQALAARRDKPEQSER